MCASKKCFLLQQLLVVLFFEYTVLMIVHLLPLYSLVIANANFLVLYFNTLVNHLK